MEIQLSTFYMALMPFFLCLVKILHSVHMWKQVFCAQTSKGATGLVRGPGGELA